MTALPKLLEELDALAEKATKGPWKLDFKQIVSGQATLLMSYLVGNSTTGPGATVSMASDRPADHELVVALVNAYPALRAAARDAEGLREQLRAAMDDVGKYRRLYECAQNANSFRQQVIEGKEG